MFLDNILACRSPHRWSNFRARKVLILLYSRNGIEYYSANSPILSSKNETFAEQFRTQKHDQSNSDLENVGESAESGPVAKRDRILLRVFANTLKQKCTLPRSNFEQGDMTNPILIGKTWDNLPSRGRWRNGIENYSA